MPSNHLILCCPLLLLLSFPASESFPMSWLYTSGGQSIGTSGFVLPVNIQDWFPLGLTSVISVQSKELSRVFSSTTVRKHLWRSAFFMVRLSHVHMSNGKTIALTMWTFVGKVMYLLFNMRSRFDTFLLRSKHLLISWLQSPSAVNLEPKKIVCHCFHCYPHLSAMKWWDQMPWS